jgi:hypothetical protein
MENLSFKHVLIFGLGCLVGGLSTYKIVKDRFEKQYTEEVLAYREHIRATYFSPTEAMEDSTPAEVVMSETKPAVNDETPYNKIARNYSNIANKQDIESVMRERGLVRDPSPQDDEAEDDEEDNLEERPIQDITLGEGVYIIPTQDYVEEYNNNDKLTITYYAGDDVLTDDKDSPIDDVDATIGVGTLNKFGFRSNSPNTVYVRNHRLAIDFEVVRVEDSFRSAVLGYEEEEPTVKPIGKNNLEPKKRTKRVKKDGEN